jgi:hypothetical protein
MRSSRQADSTAWKSSRSLQPGHLQRLQRQLHAVGAHRHAGGAQHAGEVHDVLGQPARPGVQAGAGDLRQ